MERRREPNKSPVARIHDPMELEDGMTKFAVSGWNPRLPGCAQHSLNSDLQAVSAAATGAAEAGVPHGNVPDDPFAPIRPCAAGRQVASGANASDPDS